MSLYEDLLTEIASGKLTPAEFAEIIERYAANASNVRVAGANTALLYSGAFEEGSEAWRFAQDLAQRSGGKIAIVDDTPLGRLMHRLSNPSELKNLLRELPMSLQTLFKLVGLRILKRESQFLQF